ncbi:hypothetical protein P7C73_g4006, partial [Tremellales sp. Uapishka_1]
MSQRSSSPTPATCRGEGSTPYPWSISKLDAPNERAAPPAVPSSISSGLSADLETPTEFETAPENPDSPLDSDIEILNLPPAGHSATPRRPRLLPSPLDQLTHHRKRHGPCPLDPTTKADDGELADANKTIEALLEAQEMYLERLLVENNEVQQDTGRYETHQQHLLPKVRSLVVALKYQLIIIGKVRKESIVGGACAERPIIVQGLPKKIEDEKVNQAKDHEAEQVSKNFCQELSEQPSHSENVSDHLTGSVKHASAVVDVDDQAVRNLQKIEGDISIPFVSYTVRKSTKEFKSEKEMKAWVTKAITTIWHRLMGVNPSSGKTTKGYLDFNEHPPPATESGYQQVKIDDKDQMCYRPPMDPEDKRYISFRIAMMDILRRKCDETISNDMIKGQLEIYRVHKLEAWEAYLAEETEMRKDKRNAEVRVHERKLAELEARKLYWDASPFSNVEVMERVREAILHIMTVTSKIALSEANSFFKYGTAEWHHYFEESESYFNTFHERGSARIESAQVHWQLQYVVRIYDKWLQYHLPFRNHPGRNSKLDDWFDVPKSYWTQEEVDIPSLAPDDVAKAYEWVRLLSVDKSIVEARSRLEGMTGIPVEYESSNSFSTTSAPSSATKTSTAARIPLNALEEHPGRGNGTGKNGLFLNQETKEVAQEAREPEEEGGDHAVQMQGRGMELDICARAAHHMSCIYMLYLFLFASPIPPLPATNGSV